ncbi:hypothetical protein A943_03700 [Bacillus sp. CPSM8]|nr:hypothetical protein A943_03700 [Bacillus sp. CPSM8]
MKTPVRLITKTAACVFPPLKPLKKSVKTHVSFIIPLTTLSGIESVLFLPSEEIFTQKS